MSTTAPVVRQRAYKMLAKKSGIDAFTGKAIEKGETIFYVPKGTYDKSFAVSPDSDFGLEIQTGPSWMVVDHTTTVPTVPVLTTAAPRPAPAPTTPSAAIAAALNLAAAQTAPAPVATAPAPVATAPTTPKRNHGTGFRISNVEDLIKILPLLQSGGVTLVAHPRKVQ